MTNFSYSGENNFKSKENIKDNILRIFIKEFKIKNGISLFVNPNLVVMVKVSKHGQKKHLNYQHF